MQPSSSDKALATQLLRPGQRSGKDSAASRDLHLHTRARYQADVKTELIGTKGMSVICCALFDATYSIFGKINHIK